MVKTALQVALVLLVAAFSPRVSAQGPESGIDLILQQVVDDLERSEFEAAIAGATEAIRIDPGSGEAHYLRARARRPQGDPEGALADCATLIAIESATIERDPGSAKAWYRRGYAREQKRDHDGALADYSKSIEMAPDNAEACLHRSLVRLRKGNLEGAIVDADAVVALTSKALEADPNNATSYRMRGEARILRGSREEALADANRAIENNPRDLRARLLRTTLKLRLNDLEGALADADTAVELAPNFSYTLVGRGRVKRAKGDAEGAAADFSRALELDPGDAGPCMERAILRFGAGDVGGALVDANKAVDLAPADSDALILRAAVRKAAGNPNGALDDLSKAIDLAPGRYEGYAHRARLKVLLKDRRGAQADSARTIDLATRTLALDPRDEDAWFERGHAKWKTRDVDGAIVDLSKAIDLDPASARAYYVRGLARHVKGEEEAAKADRDKAVALDPAGEYSPFPTPEPVWPTLLFMAGLLGSMAILALLVGLIVAPWKMLAGPLEMEIWDVTADDLLELPAAFTHAGDLRIARQVRRIAAGWGSVGMIASLAVAGLMWYSLLTDGSFSLGSLLPLVIVPLGLLVAAPLSYRRGLRMSRAARRLVLTPEEVTVSVPEGGRGDAWSAPLDSYTGVMGKIEARKSGDDSYKVVVFCLVHPDPQKTLRLSERGGRIADSVEESPDARRDWESYAQCLGLPALAETEEGFTTREVEDLSKPAGELVREGKLEVAFDMNTSIPEGLEVDADGNTTVVTVHAAPLPRYARPVGVALALAMLLYGLWARSVPGVAIGAGLFALAAFWRMHDARMRIAPDAIHLFTVTSKGESELGVLNPGQIENVKVTPRYMMDFTAWRSLPPFRRTVLEVEDLVVCLAEMMASLPSWLKGSDAPVTAVAKEPAAGEVGAEAVDPEASHLSQATDAPRTRALGLVTDSGLFVIPARMSPAAAEWLRGLVLSLLASRADSPSLE